MYETRLYDFYLQENKQFPVSNPSSQAVCFYNGQPTAQKAHLKCQHIAFTGSHTAINYFSSCELPQSSDIKQYSIKQNMTEESIQISNLLPR